MRAPARAKLVKMVREEPEAGVVISHSAVR